MIRPFLRRYGRLPLAHILMEEDAVIAGEIADEEYERLLKIASHRMYGRPLRRQKGAAGQLLADLAAHGVIDLSVVAELQLVWDVRNRVVHPDPQTVTPEEVERMIETVERICQPWETSKGRFAAAKVSKSGLCEIGIGTSNTCDSCFVTAVTRLATRVQCASKRPRCRRHIPIDLLSSLSLAAVSAIAWDSKWNPLMNSELREQ